MRRVSLLSLTLSVGFGFAGCDQLDMTRTGESYSSFGEAIYREGCQRVAYTGQLAQKSAGLIQNVDVQGTLGTNVCVNGAAPPADAPVKLTAIVGQKAKIVATVDAAMPKTIKKHNPDGTDTVVDSDFLGTVQNFLEQLLPLTDEGTMDRAISSLGDLLGTLAANPDFGPALSRLALRNGYRPTKTAAGLVHTIVNYDSIDQFIGKTLALIAPGGSAETEWKNLMAAASMELASSQATASPGDPNRTLRLALNLMLSTHPDLAGSGNMARPLVARDYRGLALTTTVNGKVQPPFVDMDGDGLADVDARGVYVDAGGKELSVASPFPQLGASDSAPRDAQGRALTAANAASTVYQYLDLERTLFAGVARETQQLMDPLKDKAIGLVWGMGSLLGPRKTQTKVYMDAMGGMLGSLSYNGFDTSQSAVLDLAHAFMQLLGDPNAQKTFQSVQTLLDQNESPAARLVAAMLDVYERGKTHSEAQVPATSDIYDDLMPIIARILAVPQLPQDLLVALQDPRTQDFAPMVARLMQATDQVDFDHSCKGSLCAFALLQGGHDLDHPTPPDRTQPDVDYNRSLMQRIAHTIHDSNGKRFCNKAGAKPTVLGITFPVVLAGPNPGYSECGLFKIDDLALFYILNMQTKDSNGKPISTNPSAVSGADFCAHMTSGDALSLGCSLAIGGTVGIQGFGQYPTSASLNRSLFLKSSDPGKPQFLKDTTTDIPCNDGDLFIDVHDHSLVAWETTMPGSKVAGATFYTAIAPIVDAFAKHDECTAYDANMVCTAHQNAAKILIDLFAMLHEHWASPKSTYFGHSYQQSDPTKARYAQLDNVVSYEPLLAEALGQSDLIEAVRGLAPTLLSMTIDGTSNTTNALPTLIESAKYIFVPNAQYGIAYRNGDTTTVMSDGVTKVPVATPYYLIADAYAHKRQALASGDAMQSATWKSATSALVDQFLTVDKNADGTWQFRNRHFRAISLLVVQFLRDRIKAHTLAGDVDTWVHSKLTSDLTDTLGGPAFAALADLTAKIEGDPDARTQLYQLVKYLVTESTDDLVFQTALTTLADQAQLFLDDPDLIPVAHALGSAIDPQRGAVDAQLTLMKRAHDVDTKLTLIQLLKNLYQPDATGIYPASNLADILSQLNRKDPSASGDLSGDDYNSILTEVQTFLKDQQSGFSHFLAIVKNRGPQ
jgi:hypothetical protein